MLQAAEYFKKISEILILCVELDGARELAELGNMSVVKLDTICFSAQQDRRFVCETHVERIIEFVRSLEVLPPLRRDHLDLLPSLEVLPPLRREHLDLKLSA